MTCISFLDLSTDTNMLTALQFYDQLYIKKERHLFEQFVFAIFAYLFLFILSDTQFAKDVPLCFIMESLKDTRHGLCS